MAHVWTEVWAGEVNGKERWGMADPTTNSAILKSWYGYYKVVDAESVPMYYLPTEAESFCKGF